MKETSMEPETSVPSPISARKLEPRGEHDPDRFNGAMRQRADMPRVSGGAAMQRMLEIDKHADALTTQRRQTWLEKLFPSAAQRARAAGEVKMTETEVEFRVRTLQVKRDFELK